MRWGRGVRATGYLRGARSWALGEALAWANPAQATPAGLVAMLMASPPSDIRFADSPEYHISMKATSMQKGIAAAVMSEPRNSPSSSTRINSTRTSPSISDLTTVWMLLSTSSD